MQKILKLLEQHVQWAALALGGLFLLYAVWIYPIGNPATKKVKIGDATVVATPDNVDSLVFEQADALDHHMGGTHPDFQVKVEIPTTLPLDPDASAVAVNSRAWDSWPFDASTIAGPKGANGAEKAVAVALPELPALHYVDQETLRTVPLPVVDANGVGPHQDMDAVTTFWSLPMDQLAKALKDAFGSLPPSAQNVQFVHASVVRQVQLDGGSWGPDEAVGPGFNLPVPPVAYPSADDPQRKDKIARYRTWLAGPPNEQQNIVSAPFPAPVYPERADLKWRSLEDWVPYRAQLEAGVVPTGPAAGPAAAAAAPVFSNAIDDVDKVVPIAPRTPARGPAAVAPAVAAAPVAPAVAPKLSPVPDGSFNPAAPAAAPAAPALGAPGEAPAAAAIPDMGLWFHDLKAEPGKTYRYKVQYTLSNPVFSQPSMVKDIKLADVFGIDSAWSDWSKPITISGRTRFFFSSKPNAPTNSDTADCTVYTWHDGQWQHHAYSTAPGDEIGADEGAAGNFLTHWTLLDLPGGRADATAKLVLLIPDKGGTVQKRDLRTDATNEEFTKFKKEVDATPANGSPAAPQPPPAQPAAAQPAAAVPGANPNNAF